MRAVTIVQPLFTLVPNSWLWGLETLDLLSLESLLRDFHYSKAPDVDRDSVSVWFFLQSLNSSLLPKAMCLRSFSTEDPQKAHYIGIPITRKILHSMSAAKRLQESITVLQELLRH